MDDLRRVGFGNESGITERRTSTTSALQRILLGMTDQPDAALRITYGRKLATTVALAAAEHGMTVKHMATTLERLGIAPLPRADDPEQPARLDGRTLLYDRKEISARLAARPGRGANLRGHG